MAVKKTSNNEAAASVGHEPRYALAELKGHAQELFGVKAEVMAGAFFQAEDERFSVTEARAKIEQFMKAKVD
ncbi:hypothetical protein [Paenibacillus chibensis]|uniref:hypothetical protein n=1 Tax=Paenibacillus chibensis TaxID=59846 RepID=UPI000FD6DE0E|nr:hypothetical protein [Paenibacillus chibensis]MEC0369426.1 hypothetical protein [Paenibacillus chibensis]